MKFEIVAGFCALMIGSSCIVGMSSKSNSSLGSSKERLNFSLEEKPYKERFPEPEIDFNIPDIAYRSIA